MGLPTGRMHARISLTDDIPNASSQASASQAMPAGPHTIMLFSGCPRPLGVSVTLKGPTATTLEKLGDLVREHVFAAYWNRLEASMLSTWFVSAALTGAADGALPDTFVKDAVEAAKFCHSYQTVQRAFDGASWMASPYISFYNDTRDVGTASGGASPLANGPGTGSPSRSSMEVSTEREGDVSGQPRCADTQLTTSFAPASGLSLGHCLRHLPVTVMCKNPTKGVLCEAAHELLMQFYAKSGAMGLLFGLILPIRRLERGFSRQTSTNIFLCTPYAS